MTQESPFPECYVFWEVHRPNEKNKRMRQFECFKETSRLALEVSKNTSEWEEKTKFDFWKSKD